MASGFGYSHSSGYITAGYGRIYASANVTQSVNATNRTVTISVRALLTYYRASGGSWNPGTSTLFENSISSNYIRATLDGSSASDGSHLGLRGANTTLTVGNYYDLYLGGVAAYDVAQVTKSTTFNYNTAGDAITKSWAVNIQYDGTGLSLSGSVTTDSIPASGNPPSNGYVTGLSSYYSNGEPWIHADSVGVNDGGLTLTNLLLTITESPFDAVAIGRKKSITNGSAIDVAQSNTEPVFAGNSPIVYNHAYNMGLYASNNQGEYRYQGPVVVTVPAPANFSVNSVGSATAVINYFSSPDSGHYPVTMQYSLDNTTWIDAATVTDSTVASQGRMIVAGLTPGVANTIYLRPLTPAGGSKVVILTVTTKKAVLYGSVNGDSEKIIKLYGSVGGESKAIKKLYGSVNGRAKLIYKEN